MTGKKAQTDREQLEQAISALENQRTVLGDAVVDAALASMRETLSALLGAHKETQQRKLATVLFMDIVGSTSISQGLDPEDIMTIMDTALRRLAGPVHAHGGRVTRFMGDGFLALFGVPLARENDPEMAVRAGLEMLTESRRYAQELKTQWHIPDFSIRIGVNTGLVIIGGDTEAEDTIMGTAVNLAARLENAAKPGTLLISDHTHQHVRGAFDLQLLEPIAVKGFAAPVEVYQVKQAKPGGFRRSSWRVAGIETHMIGREPELLRLQNMFRDAKEDAEVQLVTIVGDAGLGKSRLLYEFENWLELIPEEIRQFRAGCVPETETMPYGLIRRLLAQRFAITESDSGAQVQDKFREGMAAVLKSSQADLVGHLLGFDFSTSQAVKNRLGSESFGELATAHLVEYLRLIASEPTVITVDGIHWADDSSLDLLDYLVTAASGTRLLVVCLARPTLFERRPNWGEGQESHTQIDLKPLSRRASRALVGEILQKAGSVPHELRELIVERAEGYPFCIEELIRILIEDGVIVQREQQWQVELERLAEVRVPSTLTGILQARLDRLPPGEKAILQMASVVGRVFWTAAVAELASDEVEAAQVDKLLGDLRDRELIYLREQSVLETTDEYIFKNSALRDITYETVLLRQRRVYHVQVAQWLEGSAGERINEYLSLIARQYELAGETAEAVGFLKRLGEESLQVGAFRDAVRAFERILALLPAVSRDEAQRSSDIKLPDVDLAERAMLLVKLGNLYNRVGDCQKAVEYLERGLNLARMADDRQAEIAALSRLAQLDSERGSYDTAQRYLDEVLLLAREQEDQDTVASALSMLSTIAWKWGDLERAEECCRESLGIYRELGNRREVPQMLNILGILATLQENYDLAEKQYEQGLTMAREVDDRQLVADLLNNLGYLNHHCTGSLKKAKRRYQESLLIAREIGHCFGVTSTLINLGQLHIRLGEPQIAWEYLREALQESVAIGAVPLTLEALVGVARQRTEAGQPMAAAELLGLVLNHPALEIDTRQEADSALGELRQVMSAKQLESALERGKVLEMGAVIAELEAMMAKMLEGPPI